MPTVTVQQSFELALQHHQAGRLAEAEALYRRGAGGAARSCGCVAIARGHRLSVRPPCRGRRSAAPGAGFSIRGITSRCPISVKPGGRWAGSMTPWPAIGGRSRSAPTTRAPTSTSAMRWPIKAGSTKRLPPFAARWNWSPAMPTRTTTWAWCWPGGSISTKQRPRTVARSGCNPIMGRRTTTSASPWRGSAGGRRRWRLIAGPSSSSPNTRKHITTWAMP